MRTPRQPAQNPFGADDRQTVCFKGSVKGRGEQNASRRYKASQGFDEKVDLTDMLENFHRMARPVQLAIISGVLRAEPSRHTEIIKEELRYLVVHKTRDEGVH